MRAAVLRGMALYITLDACYEEDPPGDVRVRFLDTADLPEDEAAYMEEMLEQALGGDLRDIWDAINADGWEHDSYQPTLDRAPWLAKARVIFTIDTDNNPRATEGKG